MAHSSCGFQTFEHTADIGIRAWGAESKDVFVEMARALFSVMADLSNINATQKVDIHLTAENSQELLLIWLKELLFIFDTKHLLLADFKIKKLDTHSIVAEAAGEAVEEKEHILGREVKAITRHQFKFERKGALWISEVILDI